MLDRCRGRKIFGGPTMTRLMVVVGIYLLLLALVIAFNHGAHRH